MSAETDDGDGWKDEDYKLTGWPLNAIYKLQEFLLNNLVARNNYLEAFLDVAEYFRPPKAVKRLWERDCLDAVIQGYINNDLVFVRINSPSIAWNKYHQVMSAYREGIEYAMSEGVFRTEAMEWLKANTKKEDWPPEEDDKA